MRKLKQATQREKARRALKDKQAAEPIAGEAESHQRQIPYEDIGSRSPGNKPGPRRRAAPPQKITHH